MRNVSRSGSRHSDVTLAVPGIVRTDGRSRNESYGDPRRQYVPSRGNERAVLPEHVEGTGARRGRRRSGRRTVLCFVGLERIGSLVVYDVSDPMAPRFVQYSNNRNFEVDPIADVEQGDADVSDVGDLGPEGVKFIPVSDSPVDEPVVAVGNELDGTTTLYRVRTLGAVDSVTGPPSTSRTVGVRGNSRPGAGGAASHGIGRNAIDVCRGRYRRISDRRGGIRFCG